MTLDLVLADAGATERCGRALAPVLAGGMAITLSGPLGSGKTTLVRGLLRALGVRGAIRSPTFGLVEHYSVSSLYFYHIDLYRFAYSSEWDSAGLAECFRSDSVCLVEWPERASERMREPDLALVLGYLPGGAGRRLQSLAAGARGERCESAIRSAMSARP